MNSHKEKVAKVRKHGMKDTIWCHRNASQNQPTLRLLALKKVLVRHILRNMDSSTPPPRHDGSQSFDSGPRRRNKEWPSFSIEIFSTFDSKNMIQNLLWLVSLSNSNKFMAIFRFQITRECVYSYPSGFATGTNTQSKFSDSFFISGSSDVSNSFKMYVAVAAVTHSRAWIVDSMKIVGLFWSNHWKSDINIHQMHKFFF